MTTDFVGVVSSRLEEREPGRPNFDGFEALVSQMDERSFWSPKFRRLESRRQIQYWITAQDGIHPGMSRVLSLVQGRLYKDPLLTKGVAANGNQFVVERNQWLQFVEMWRQGLLLVEESFGIDFPYDYRCWKCHRRHPNGYGRYTKERHLGFFGERMTALHFAHQGLTSSTYDGRALEEAMPLSWAPDIFLPLAAKAIEPYWRLTGTIAGKCDVCKGSNEFAKPWFAKS